MRKFNSPTLLTSHNYLLKVSKVLESSNKIHPNTEDEFKVFFFNTSLGTYNLCILSIQTKQALPGRFTTPDEVAGLASFLVSEDAAMITGMLNITSYKSFQFDGKSSGQSVGTDGKKCRRSILIKIRFLSMEAFSLIEVF